jgi:hypothetical protein
MGHCCYTDWQYPRQQMTRFSAKKIARIRCHAAGIFENKNPATARQAGDRNPLASCRLATISFRPLYGLLILHHGRRQIVWLE